MKVDKPCPHCGAAVAVDAIEQGQLLVEVRVVCSGCSRTGSAPLAGIPAGAVNAKGKFSPAQAALIAAHHAALQDLAQRK